MFKKNFFYFIFLNKIFLTIFYLDEFKLSKYKLIKYSQIIIFTSFIYYVIYLIITIFLWNNNLLNDIICHVNPDDKNINENNKVTLQGKVVIDKYAGAEVAKVLSNVGSNVGLGACVGALAGGVAKTVSKSSIPPFQKAGLVVASGITGAVLHTGASAINAQTHAASSINKYSEDIGKNASSKDLNNFLDFGNDIAPIEIILQCINILSWVSIWLIIIISIQYFFKVYIADKPRLKILNSLSPYYGDKIKKYIYMLVVLNKKVSIVYTILAFILLFISISGSTYFSWELYNNLNSYIDVYIEYRKK